MGIRGVGSMPNNSNGQPQKVRQEPLLSGRKVATKNPEQSHVTPTGPTIVPLFSTRPP
jgi:hypothetical protein